MKTLIVYDRSEPQSVAAAVIFMLKYPDHQLINTEGLNEASITAAIAAITDDDFDQVLSCVDSAESHSTGNLTSEQVVTLDAKLERGTANASGTATAGGSDTLTDSGSGWEVDEFAGMYVKIYEGTGIGQVRTIESNTSEILTVTEDWDENPDTDSKFYVYENRDSFSHEIDDTSGNKKRALIAWEHDKGFPTKNEPLIIYKLGGDKTTASSSVNTQDALDEDYIEWGVKYLMSDLTDSNVIDDWKKLIGNGANVNSVLSKSFEQDVYFYMELYKYSKRGYSSDDEF